MRTNRFYGNQKIGVGILSLQSVLYQKTCVTIVSIYQGFYWKSIPIGAMSVAGKEYAYSIVPKILFPFVRYWGEKVLS